LGVDPKEDALISGQSILRQTLHSLLLFFAKTYNSIFGLGTGPPLHDPVAVAVLLSNLNPAMGPREMSENMLRFSDNDGERFVVNVVTEGQHGRDPLRTGQLGRTIVKPVPGGKKVGGIAIPRRVDVDAFWDMIVDCIQRADQWNIAGSGRKDRD
jgi:uridine nucleosidase